MRLPQQVKHTIQACFFVRSVVAIQYHRTTLLLTCRIAIEDKDKDLEGDMLINRSRKAQNSGGLDSTVV